MAAPTSQQSQAPSLDAKMATMSLESRNVRKTNPQPPYLDQVLAAVKSLSTMKEIPFQSKTNWPGCKNAGTAASRRYNANKLMKKPRKVNGRGVLMLLTQCICSLPYPSAESGVSGAELAAAFAARAGYFLDVQAYAACVADIERARAIFPDAPDAVRMQWAARKGEALARQAQKTRVTYDGAEPLQMSELMERGEMPPMRSFPEHPIPSGVSEMLEVRPDPLNVTRLVAATDIRIGDVVHAERPFASVLAAECFISHCFYCMTARDDMIPCKTCSMVQYCCEHCRNADASLFHQWECPLLGTLVQMMGPEESWQPMLTLRLFLVAVYANRGLDPLLDFISFLDSQGFETSRGFDSEGRYELPGGFPTVHYSTRSSPLNTELPHLAAVMLMGLDNHTGFFQRYPADLDKKMRVGALLLRYGVVVHDLTHHVDSVSPARNGRWSCFVLAAGIYPVGGLGRHSCNPNTIRAFRGDNLVLMATENIAKGEEVTSCFGMSYLTHDLPTRQAKFTKYTEECKCEACAKQWPTQEALSRLQPTYQCVQCRAELPFQLGTTATDVLVDCAVCRRPNNILTNKIEEQEVKTQLAGVRQRITLMNDSPARFSAILIRALTKLSAFLRPPDAQLAAVLSLLQDSIRHGGPGNKPRPSDKPRPSETSGRKPRLQDAAAAIGAAPARENGDGDGPAQSDSRLEVVPEAKGEVPAEDDNNNAPGTDAARDEEGSEELPDSGAGREAHARS